MKLYKLVDKYHRDTNLTCAEAMFKACSEYYNLNLTEESRALFSLMALECKLKCQIAALLLLRLG